MNFVKMKKLFDQIITEGYKNNEIKSILSKFSETLNLEENDDDLFKLLILFKIGVYYKGNEVILKTKNHELVCLDNDIKRNILLIACLESNH